jgi:uncharacterized protein
LLGVLVPRDKTSRDWEPAAATHNGAMLNDLRGTGPALITGASSGIGLALARRLAANGFDLVLVLPPWDDASDCERLEQEYDVHVELWRHDLTNQADAAELGELLRARDFAVVCANAGIGRFGPYWENDNVPMALVNVVGISLVLDAVLPAMVRRRHGAVLLTGSVAGWASIPGAAVYGATKAYIGALGGALQTELAPHGISVTVLKPGPVLTDFARRADATEVANRIPRWLWIDADTAARTAIEAMERGHKVALPGWQSVAFRAVTALPGAVLNRVTAAVMDLAGPGARHPT